MNRALHESLTPPVLAVSLFLALAGCGSNKSAGDIVVDAAPHGHGDGPAQTRTSDAPLAQDTATPNQSPDSARASTDLIVADTAVSSKDAAREAAVIPAVDSTPARPDTATRDDAIFRADARVPDSMVGEPDAEALACNIVVPTPPLGRLTPKELKAILDSSEDPYLINVKGSSIANIPGTDAVLASDVAGIEALVGGKLCADIIIYCRTGVTSQTVGNQLVAKGYQHVRDLSGGITAWTAAGYPTE